MDCKHINGSVFFPLSKGQVGICDYPDWVKYVNGKNWTARPLNRKNRTIYHAKTNFKKPDGKYTTIYLHRLIMDCPKGLVVDHINLNGLDNRRSNLRICSNRENILNTKSKKYSNLPGVTMNKGEWAMQWEQRLAGPYDTELEAFYAYKEIALEAGVNPDFLDESKYIN